MSRSIRVWWWRGAVRNFGDELSPYLVERLTGKKVVFGANSRFPIPKTHMVIGSILGAATRNCKVWGAGINSLDQRVFGGTFYAVRGPHTRQRLLDCGLHCPESYGDPALLMPMVHQPPPGVKSGIGVIPHFLDLPDIQAQGLPPGYTLIDVSADPVKVMDKIAGCEATISSSLHGVIVSHAYGIPSSWVEFSDRIIGDGIKFRDYFESVGLPSLCCDLRENRDFGKVEKSMQLPVVHAVKSLQSSLLDSCPFSVLEGVLLRFGAHVP